MIRYALSCDQKHSFESWFQSAEAYDLLEKSGHLACAVCGSSAVSKSIMAPQLSTNVTAPLSAPASPAEQALKDLRTKIEANSEDVGGNFAKEARAIHDGTAPERAIYGEANIAQAKSLVEDGIPVIPLPFAPKRRSN